MDKNDTGRRSHYLTVQMSIHDAPAADELIAVFGGATGGRPHHRIGDRYTDLAADWRRYRKPSWCRVCLIAVSLPSMGALILHCVFGPSGGTRVTY